MILPFRQQKESYETILSKYLRNILSIKPKNIELYKMAFIHRTASTGNAIYGRINNERLEFLGDAIISSIIADYLFRKFPLHSEGKLTEMRSKLVCRDHLNVLAKKMAIETLLTSNSNSLSKSSNGNALEALIAAIYLDKGYKKTKEIFIKKILTTFMDVDSVLAEDVNYKSKLLNWGQKKSIKIRFEHTFQQVHQGRKLFFAQVFVNDQFAGEGSDFTIKKAEQAAAAKAWQQISSNKDDKTKI